jgi:hypothetical protein
MSFNDLIYTRISSNSDDIYPLITGIYCLVYSLFYCTVTWCLHVTSVVAQI